MLDLTKFDQTPDPVMTRIFNDRKWTLLFVGRVIPNKKFEDAIKCFHVYRKYFNPQSRLILAGDFRGMDRYYAGLQQLVRQLVLQDVFFTGHIRFQELVAFYNLADVYLSMSEHEGFGVPLLEAFYNNLPVVAYAAGAVEETLNGGGVLVREKNFLKIAAVLDLIQRDPKIREKIIAGQHQSLVRYNRETTVQLLMEHIHRVGQT